jgi:6-phosphogluconolactonase (cycloisomerase 2 family)
MAGDRIQGHAFVSNFDSDTVSVFEIAAGGSLTLTAVVPLTGGARQPLAGAITPDGRYLFYANFGSADVSTLCVSNTGPYRPLVRSLHCLLGHYQTHQVSPSHRTANG